MQILLLTDGTQSIVDDQYFEQLTEMGGWYLWSSPRQRSRYAIRRFTKTDGSAGTIRMHHAVWRLAGHTDERPRIDHRNGNGLDNRIENLRAATKQQNAYNVAVKRTSSSGIKGIERTKTGGRWRARIRVDGKRIDLGVFDTPELAGLAYDAAAVRYQGEFARLNFPR